MCWFDIQKWMNEWTNQNDNDDDGDAVEKRNIHTEENLIWKNNNKKQYDDEDESIQQSTHSTGYRFTKRSQQTQHPTPIVARAASVAMTTTTANKKNMVEKEQRDAKNAICWKVRVWT